MEEARRVIRGAKEQEKADAIEENEKCMKNLQKKGFRGVDLNALVGERKNEEGKKAEEGDAPSGLSPFVLCTDLDGTLVGDKDALSTFNDLWRSLTGRASLVYNTGR